MRDKSYPILPALIYELFAVISVQKAYSPGYKLTHLFTKNKPLGKEILRRWFCLEPALFVLTTDP